VKLNEIQAYENENLLIIIISLELVFDKLEGPF